MILIFYIYCLCRIVGTSSILYQHNACLHGCLHRSRKQHRKNVILPFHYTQCSRTLMEFAQKGKCSIHPHHKSICRFLILESYLEFLKKGILYSYPSQIIIYAASLILELFRRQKRNLSFIHIIEGNTLGVAPLTVTVTTRSMNNFLLGDPNLNLHFPLLLGGGHTQVIPLSDPKKFMFPSVDAVTVPLNPALQVHPLGMSVPGHGTLRKSP